MSEPIENGATESERNPDGTFKKGNPGGPGSPYMKQVAKFRAVLMRKVSEEDVADVIANVLSIAKGLDDASKPADQIAAAKLMLDRLLGPVANTVEFGSDGEGGIIFRMVPKRDEEDDGDGRSE